MARIGWWTAHLYQSSTDEFNLKSMPEGLEVLIGGEAILPGLHAMIGRHTALRDEPRRALLY